MNMLRCLSIISLAVFPLLVVSCRLDASKPSPASRPAPTAATAPAATAQGDDAMPVSGGNVSPEAAGFGPRELKAIEETLYTINVKPSDLGYHKGPLPVDPCRLPLVQKMMGDPISIPAQADRLLNPLRKGGRPSDVMALLAAEMPGGAKLEVGDLKPLDVKLAPEQTKDVPDWLQPIIARLAGAYRMSRAERDLAFADLKPEDRKLLLDNINGFLQEEDLGFKLDKAIEKDPAPYWKIIESVKYEHIWRSGLYMMREIEVACDAIKKSAPQWKGWKGVVRLATPEGDIVIGGLGHNRYEQAAGVIIDLGGQNTYVGEATRAWIVNFEGGNHYKAPSISLGAGILDCRVLWDWQGDDVYEGQSMTQGFGAFGMGLLINEGGHNTYRADMFAQGAARSWSVGLLANRGGHNIYQAGGKFIDKPLLEKEGFTYSMSQGFAIGYRGDNNGTPSRSGGIGLMWSGAGYNTYAGGTFCQGASYWFAFGCLCDDGGNNQFVANYYSQASAMHMTVAALITHGSQNVYAINIGASHAIGHDWGVALLWTEGGSNLFAAGGACAGTAVANGVGIFVVSAGNNRYMLEGPVNANLARDSGSLALFVELGGKSQYFNKDFKDGGIKIDKNPWGVARSFGEPPAPPPAAATTGPATQEADAIIGDPRTHHGPLGSRPLADEKELDKLYDDACLWAVGSTRNKAWAARWKLIEMGLPAAKWIAQKKLASAQSLTFECLEPLFKEFGPESHPFLVEALRSKNNDEVANALRLVTILNATEADAEVLRILKDNDKLRRMAAGAAAILGIKEAAPLIIKSCNEKEPMSQLSTALAMVKLAEPSAMPWLLAHLRNTELPVRDACGDALAKIGAPAVPDLTKLAGDQNPFAARLAIRILGQIGNPQCLQAVLTRQNDPDWGVRLSVLQALRAMKLPEAKTAFDTALAKESDPRVKAAIQGQVFERP
jgi:hypothetical protein